MSHWFVCIPCGGDTGGRSMKDVGGRGVILHTFNEMEAGLGWLEMQL